MADILTNIQKQGLIKLFNKSGYVMDFSNVSFGNFTMGSIGIDLQEKYHGSKGASLEAFIYKGDSNLVIKLLKDLLEYYETFNYKNDFENTKENEKPLYLKCKQILDGVKINDYILLTETFDNKVNSDYISKQLDLMISQQKSNPTEAIGKAKELIESCCKTILSEIGEPYKNTDDVSDLINKTINILNLSPKNIKDSQKAGDIIKQILGNMRAIATGVAELRNPFGSGHGKDAKYKGLEERHAKLAIGSTMTLVNFLWDSYESQFKQGVTNETKV